MTRAACEQLVSLWLSIEEDFMTAKTGRNDSTIRSGGWIYSPLTRINPDSPKVINWVAVRIYIDGEKGFID